MADNKANKCTPVADDWNWTARIRNELGANKAWQRNWGFLLDPQFQAGQQRQPGQQQQPPPAGGTSSAAPDSLAAFMESANQGSLSPTSMSYIAAKQRDSARARRLQQQDSLDGFVSSFVAKGDPRVRELPAKEFRKPLLTSHDIGWGRNLEVFGNMALVMK